MASDSSFAMTYPCVQSGKIAFQGLMSRRQPDRFGSFKPLSLEAKTLYDRCAEFLPGSVTSPLYFQSLYAWDFTSVNKYRIFDTHLCFAVNDKMAGEIFALPPLGELRGKSFASAVRAVFDEFGREGLPCVFQEVPGFMLPYFSGLPDYAGYSGYKVEVSYDRDWSDYVFTRDDFADGLQKTSAREARRSFERNFHPCVREIAPSDKDLVRALTQKFFCAERDCRDCFCGCELDVQSRTMESWDALGMKGVIVESGGEALAFGSVCFQKDTMLFFSKKVRRRTRGVNEYLNAALMDGFAGECRYVNYSDDMGSDGLRSYKNRLGRHTLAHRYRVKLSRFSHAGT